MKYIDAEKLIAEIERRINIKENLTQHPEMSDMKESLCDIILAYQSLKSFIDSLQQEQPVIDLEKVVMVDNIIMNMVGEGYNDGYKTRPFYEEVMRRINAGK